MRPPIHLVAAPLAALLALVPSAGAQEQSDWYFQIGLGGNSHADSAGLTRDITFDSGYNLSALVGRRLDAAEGGRLGLAVELEALYTDDEIAGDGLLTAGSSSLDDVRSFSLLVNGVVECRLAPDLNLYAGLGIGYASSVELNSLGDGPPALSGDAREFQLVDESGLAYQAKLGLRFDLGGDRNFSWIVGGRLFGIEDLTATDRDLNQSFDLETQVLAFETGLRWGI